MKSRYSVLLYHGVHADNTVLDGRNSFGKHVSQSSFRQDMKWIAENLPVVTMQQIADAHFGNSPIPDRSVAVTFDDGFLNNYSSAWPVLEEFGVPATIYVSTGYIGTNRKVWTDQLESAFLSSAKESFSYQIGDAVLEHTLGSQSGKINAYLQTKAWCKTLTATDLERAVAEIVICLGGQADDEPDLYAFMEWSHIQEMSQSSLIDFGAHTIDHVSLARVSEADMQHQISGSIETLTRELGMPCTLFAYPEGTKADYNDAVIKYLKEIGITHAPTANEGDNEIGVTDPFHINRYLVGIEGRPMPLRSKTRQDASI